MNPYIELSGLGQLLEQVAMQTGAEVLAPLLRRESLGERIAAEIRRMEEQIHAAAISFEHESERWATTMVLLGWPPPLQLPVSLMKRLVDLYESDQATEAEVAELFVEFYDADELERMVQEWRGRRWLSRRCQILTDAIQAHVQGRYTLSIPAILPQIEGAVADAFAHEGRLRKQDLETYTEQLLGGERPSAATFLAAAREVYLSSILERFDWGDPRPTLSRHAILHGADTEYATPEKSLRVILLFNYVQDAVRYVGTVGGRAYHRPGCSVLGRTTTDRVVFARESVAAERRRECSICGLPR